MADVNVTVKKLQPHVDVMLANGKCILDPEFENAACAAFR